MILEFKTRRNACGHRHYLIIDTGAEEYSRNTRYMITEGVEIKKTDYNEIIETLRRYGYTEREYIF